MSEPKQDRTLNVVMSESDFEAIKKAIGHRISWMLDRHPAYEDDVTELSRLEARLRKAVIVAENKLKSKKIIHVNRQHIAMNAKDGGSRPVYTMKEGKHTTYARSATIEGPVKLVYSPKGLSCGAKAWIETDSNVILEAPMTFKKAREQKGAGHE